MMKYTYLLYPLLSLGVLTNVSYANTFCQTAEHEINTSYKKFRDFDDVNLLDNFDKNAENLSALILKTLNDKQSLACDWSNLTELDVNKSPDGRLLSISWQTDGGGTMKTFDTALQYHDGKHLHATTIDNGFVMNIHQMLLNKQPVYFINSWGAGDTSLHGQALSLFGIKNHKITPAKLIKTKQGLSHQIDFTYNSFSIPDDMDELIQINTQKKEFSIPVIIENDKYPNGEVTKRVLRYRYNGTYFVYTK